MPQIEAQGAYLQRIWNSSVYPLAEQLGLTMRLPPVKPRSRLAHEASHWAREQGRFDDYNDAIFTAYFEQGEDIGDIEVLVTIASAIDLDGHSLRDALTAHAFLPSVLSDEREAATIRLHSVPTFVANRKAALSGVQPVENLKRLVESVRD